MRTIIAGSRSATEAQVREAFYKCPWTGFISAIVSGAAPGADTVGEHLAAERDLPVLQFPADWKQFGKRAGPIRNRKMAESAEALLAVWDGKSRGTVNMISTARKLGLRVFVYRADDGAIMEHVPSGRLRDIWERAEERAAMKEFEGSSARTEAEKSAGTEAVQFRLEVEAQSEGVDTGS